MAQDMTTDLIEDAPRTGTGGNTGSTGSATGSGSAASSATMGKVKEHASGLMGEAANAARNVANEGKEKASEALTNVSKAVENLAQLVEEKVGAQYGGYARQAATRVSTLAETIQNKDIDDLVDDTRTFVRNSPMVALGAAAAIGFALTRLAKISTETNATPRSSDNV